MKFVEKLLVDFAMAQIPYDTPEKADKSLTALQKRIYKTAEDRYRSKHFTALSVEVVPATQEHYEPIRGILLRAYEQVAPDLYSTGYDATLTNLEDRAETVSYTHLTLPTTPYV